MTNNSYVELIENFLSTELSVGFDADALEVSKHVTEDQLKMLGEHFWENDKAEHARMIRPDRHSDEDVEPATSAMFDHPYNGLNDLSLEHLKRQLLFFSKVSITTPVPTWAYCKSLEERQIEFRSFLRSFLDLKKLIKDESIVLSPHFGFYSNEIEGGAGLVRKFCKEDNLARTWIESNTKSLEDFSLGARPGDPYFDAGIRICSAISYGQTLAATHPFVGSIYSLMLNDEHVIERENIAMTQNLNQIHLPGLSGLSWNDITSVRNDEDCLNKWRADLQVAITSVDPNLPPEEYVNRFNSQVKALLTRASLDLERDLKKTSTLNRFKTGAVGLTISAIAASFGLLKDPTRIDWSEVIEVFSKDGPKEAIRFIWGTRQGSSKQSLRNHYNVFTQKR